jgi:hypothetical protein
MHWSIQINFNFFHRNGPLKGHSDEIFLLRILKDSSMCIFESIVVHQESP